MIGIVFGSLAALGGCLAPFSVLFLDALSDVVPPEQAAGFEALEKWKWWIYTSAVFIFLLAVLLLVSSIGLLKRRAWSRWGCILWAVCKMIFVLVAAYFGYEMHVDQMAAMEAQMQADMQQPMPGFGGFMQAMGVAGVVLQVIWGWALPIFLLIWFARRKVIQEVAGWAPPGHQYP